MEEKVNYRYILLVSLIVIFTMVGSLVFVYVLFWAWSTYGVLFTAFLAIAILGLIAIVYLRESRKKKDAPPRANNFGTS
jgi:membrane protein implicated in regulation of membrane protease activity